MDKNNIKIVEITDSEALQAACQRWSALPRIGIDTEFERSRTFFPILGLIQVFDGEHHYLIDPLETQNLDSFAELMMSSATIKVLHSGSEDIEILAGLCTGPVSNVFDTQIAANLAGLDYGMSYQRLVANLCGESLSKEETRSDWLKRPLSDAQRLYAALDVHYLMQLHTELLGRLQQLNRQTWAEQDFEQLLQTSCQPMDAKQLYQRFKSAWKLNGTGRSILAAALQWREDMARQRNLPRSWVVKDNQLFELAYRKPDSREQLQKYLELPQKLFRRYGQQLVDLVIAAQQQPADSHPPPFPKPLAPELKGLIKDMRTLVEQKASELAIAPELLCAKRDLISIIHQQKLPQRLTGWREQVVGLPLLTMATAAEA